MLFHIAFVMDLVAKYMAVSAFGTEWGQDWSREGTKPILFFTPFYFFFFLSDIYFHSFLPGDKERENKEKKKGRTWEDGWVGSCRSFSAAQMEGINGTIQNRFHIFFPNGLPHFLRGLFLCFRAGHLSSKVLLAQKTSCYMEQT